MAHKKTTLWIYAITVKFTQHASVPWDMIRYDQCAPATSEDASKLSRLDGLVPNRDLTKEERTVTFRMYDVARRGPTLDRWRSFGCEVVKVEAVP